MAAGVPPALGGARAIKPPVTGAFSAGAPATPGDAPVGLTKPAAAISGAKPANNVTAASAASGTVPKPAAPPTAATNATAAARAPAAAIGTRPVPTAAAAAAAAIARTVPKPAAPAPVAAKPAAAVGGGPLSSDDVQRIYTQYVAARKQNAERTDNVKLDTIERTLRGMLPQLEKKHAGKKIDFEVVVKDGRVALKPVAK